jgi:hypothetical protein
MINACYIPYCFHCLILFFPLLLDFLPTAFSITLVLWISITVFYVDVLEYSKSTFVKCLSFKVYQPNDNLC